MNRSHPAFLEARLLHSTASGFVAAGARFIRSADMGRSKQTARKSAVNKPKRAAPAARASPPPKRAAVDPSQPALPKEAFILYKKEDGPENDDHREFPPEVVGIYTSKALAIECARAQLRRMCEWTGFVDDENARESLEDYEMCDGPADCSDNDTIVRFENKEGYSIHLYIACEGLDVPPPNSKPERVAHESEKDEETETKKEEKVESKQEGQTAVAKVYTIRFEKAEEGIRRDEVSVPETIGTYSTKALAIKNAKEAMSKKLSGFDPEDEDDSMEEWDEVRRNTDPKTCPDDGYIFHFSSERNAFCSISIECVVVDKPFAAATMAVASSQAPAAAS